LPGGSDWTLLRSDGVLELDLRITLEADDGALIYMTLSACVMARLKCWPRSRVAIPLIRPSITFGPRQEFEASAPQYAYLNRLLAISSGDRRASGPIYTVEEIL